MMHIFRLVSAACLIFTSAGGSCRYLGVHAFVAAPAIISRPCFAPAIKGKKNNNIILSPSLSSLSSASSRAAAPANGKRLVQFASNKNDDCENEDIKGNNNNSRSNEGDESNPLERWITSRIQRANLSSIRRDVILTSCFVLGRYFVYDVLTGQKITPGFDVQDLVYLSGTLSSAALLGVYWTAAGLFLTRLFETRGGQGGGSEAIANAVNIAMCCPAWIATEHALHFGPSNVGGPTLDAAVANGFVGLAVFMAVMKSATYDWE